jgi:hypothetical protein
MADRIRVLSVIDGLGYVGDETRMLNMSLGLDRTRFSHSVLTLNPLAYGDANEYRARKNHYLEAGIQVDDLADCAPEHSLQITGIAGRIYRKTGVFRRARRLARLVREWKVDVIDGHLPSAGLVGALASRWTGLASAVTVYGDYTRSFQVDWPWTTRAAPRLSTSVFTDSAIRAGQMRAFLRDSPSKVVLIPNGIAEPRPARTNSEMRRYFGLSARDSAAGSGISIAVARIFNVIGPGQHERHVAGRIAAEFAASRSRARRRIELGHLYSTRDFIDVRDVAQGLIIAAVRGEGTLNLGSGCERKVEELVNEFSRASGVGVPQILRSEIPLESNGVWWTSRGYVHLDSLPRFACGPA